MRGILTLVAILFIAGCGAVGLPRPLTPAEMAGIRNTTSPLVLGVDPDGHDDIAEELIAVLRENRAFIEVGFAGTLGPRADIVGRIGYEHEPLGAVIPLFSIVSFGVIPSFFHEHQQVSLHFDGLPRRLRVDAQADAPIVMGWFALLMRASPSWALVRNPRDLPGTNRRLAEHLAAELARRSEEIHSLAARVPQRPGS